MNETFLVMVAAKPAGFVFLLIAALIARPLGRRMKDGPLKRFLFKRRGDSVERFFQSLDDKLFGLFKRRSRSQ